MKEEVKEKECKEKKIKKRTGQKRKNCSGNSEGRERKKVRRWKRARKGEESQ